MTAAAKSGGEFYTPRQMLRLLVEIVSPLRRVEYDPTCGSAGLGLRNRW